MTVLFTRNIYMKQHKAFTKTFHGTNMAVPGKCQNIHDSFRVWLVHVSSIKFLTGYYLISIPYHNMILITNTQNII